MKLLPQFSSLYILYFIIVILALLYIYAFFFYIPLINLYYHYKLLFYLCNAIASSNSVSVSSNFVAPLHIRHLQHIIHGAASNRSGEATNNKIPKPANIPITCALCHTTDARECPNLFLQGPLS